VKKPFPTTDIRVTQKKALTIEAVSLNQWPSLHDLRIIFRAKIIFVEGVHRHSDAWLVLYHLVKLRDFECLKDFGVFLLSLGHDENVAVRNESDLLVQVLVCRLRREHLQSILTYD